MPSVLAPPSRQSLFVEKYRTSLTAWARDLESRDGLIVAIARKAPRLLQLLVNEGLLSPTVLERVISERALPFITEPPGTVTVVDDAIRWGSTFRRVVNLAQVVLAPLQSASSVESLPFAIGEGADPGLLESTPRYFLKLRLPDVAPFAQDQVAAYRLGGMPLDIDHPTAVVRGDFSDTDALDELLQEVARSLSGALVSLPSCVPGPEGSAHAFAWSLVLPIPSDGFAADVCKLRFYLDAERNRLAVTAMHPIAITQATLEHAATILPASAGRIWERVSEAARPNATGLLRIATHRSLATLFNWLHSVPLLAVGLEEMVSSFDRWDWPVTTTTLWESDLRLLVGRPLAHEIAPAVSEYARIAEPWPERDPSPDVASVDIWVPEEYRDDYETQLERLRPHVTTIEDSLQAILLAQHFAIELPSRVELQDSEDRLAFGVTFGYVAERVRREMPEVSDADIHAVFDRLIDEGCIVCRYIRVPSGDNGFLWIRAYRVGEGPLEKLLHTVRLLAESLGKELKSDSIPRLLLEKLAVLALSEDLRIRRLAPLASLPTRKDFYLYGARQSVALGRERRFLLDWASDRELLLSPTAAGDDEYTRAYKLNGAMDSFLPPEDVAWDKDARRAIRDLARLVAKLHNTKGLGNDAIVLITSVATEEEHLRAAEAELDLWLHDRHASIYSSVGRMAVLAEDIRRGTASAKTQHRLARLATLVAHTANFTAQERKKTQLAHRRSAILKDIDIAVQGDQALEDLWEDLSDILTSREGRERRASGLQTILSALRIAYATNRLLRDLLAHAGWIDKGDRSKPLPDSLELLEERIWGVGGANHSRVDEFAIRFLAAWNGRPSVRDLLADARQSCEAPFPEAFSSCRRLIVEIADRCDAILSTYGSEEFRESPKILEPPLYLVMWDIEGSTDCADRQPMEEIIAKAQERIFRTLGTDLIDFRPQSRDDGNGLICRTFRDSLLVFGTLVDVYAEATNADQPGIRFRCGVEANVQGRIHYYPKNRTIDAGYGGRAYEHAARVTALFREIEADPSRWSGTLPKKPATSYFVIGEFARRYAEQEGSWPPANWRLAELPGRYAPRVHGALPIEVFLVTEREDG